MKQNDLDTSIQPNRPSTTMNQNTNQLPLLLNVIFILLLIIAVPVYATNTQTWNRSDESNPATIDHQAWQKILDTYLVTDHSSGVNRFRYSQVNSKDKQTLKAYLAQMQQIDPRSYRRSEQMAYWINLYNALTVDLILDHYPVKSIKKLGSGLFSFGPWDDGIAQVAGETITLNDIEHKILRPIWKDPRIHYAVNCASYGCPNLSSKAFTGESTEALLDLGARDYVNHARGVQFEKGKLKVSSIYHWYSEDFGGNDPSLIIHLKKYANPQLKQQLDQYKGSIDHDYDWKLNDAQ